MFSKRNGIACVFLSLGPLEVKMTRKKFDQHKQDASKTAGQRGNPGQKDAKEEQKGKSDLSHMGEKTGEKQQDQQHKDR